MIDNLSVIAGDWPPAITGSQQLVTYIECEGTAIAVACAAGGG